MRPFENMDLEYYPGPDHDDRTALERLIELSSGGAFKRLYEQLTSTYFPSGNYIWAQAPVEPRQFDKTALQAHFTLDKAGNLAQAFYDGEPASKPTKPQSVRPPHSMTPQGGRAFGRGGRKVY